ncbi:MOSC domain-containing protein [Pseudomassariella vexata]|uniref:MOSC domain-containing protein n=1 Tax=Pseudomassariella vexata TaxID=1141098 RepID=A0A1Y2ECX7_9PEZI|nr:MOSC domain-containing protein [Pseudomassariella vexata]ORY68665.1 MOSC domain-containing protein [Pseudomassariella vexata]
MGPTADVDMFAPFERDVILEVRTSRMKIMLGLAIQSGIDKEIRSGKVFVTKTGIEEDEHDLTFHGGVDKAIHGCEYCSSHYPKWRSEFPEAAERFEPGGFGENFVTSNMNERNVCIGDIMSVGSEGLLLQVSLPRQPCFKLGHRFQLKNFAPHTTKLSRTGWYYRVLREGWVQAGDEIKLVERKWPKWTIERLQEYLHRKQDNHAMNEELATIEDMGDESRGNFKNRVAKQKAKEKREAGGVNGKDEDKWIPYKIVEKKRQTPRITSFVFEAVTPETETPEDELGGHVRIKLPNGLVRSYSIARGNKNRFELGIALETNSRGGSEYFHKTAEEGHILPVGHITTDVEPAGLASNHIFIVGGIGITAFLTMLELYQRIHYNTILHYAVRSATEIPFPSRITNLGDLVHLYDASKNQRMNIPTIFATRSWNSHIYVCGPRRMMDEAAAQAKLHGLGDDDVHFEAFQANTTGDPFAVSVANQGNEKLSVGAEETLLEVLKRRFGEDDVPSSCEVGNCGTCRVTVRSGRVEHRGSALGEEEKGEGVMLSCVSRGVGPIVIEI